MQQHTSTTADARVQVGSLWIDRAHHHRLVEVIQIPDERPRPPPARARVAPAAAELPRARRGTRKRLRPRCGHDPDQRHRARSAPPATAHPRRLAMSATKAGRELASPDSRRRRAPPSRRHSDVARCRAAISAPARPPAGGTHRVPDPQPAPMPEPEQPTTPETWWESLQRAERARAGATALALADDAAAAGRRDAPRRSDLRAARRMERTAPRAGTDRPRRVRMDRGQAPGVLRMTAARCP